MESLGKAILSIQRSATARTSEVRPARAKRSAGVSKSAAGTHPRTSYYPDVAQNWHTDPAGVQGLVGFGRIVTEGEVSGIPSGARHAARSDGTDPLASRPGRSPGHGTRAVQRTSSTHGGKCRGSIGDLRSHSYSNHPGRTKILAESPSGISSVLRIGLGFVPEFEDQAIGVANPRQMHRI